MDEVEALLAAAQAETDQVEAEVLDICSRAGTRREAALLGWRAGGARTVALVYRLPMFCPHCEGVFMFGEGEPPGLEHD